MAFASEIARSFFVLTTTTRATCGRRIAAIAAAPPVVSSATSSSEPRLCANSSSSARRVLIRPAERSLPRSEIATSQNSRWTSKPMYLITGLLLSSLTRESRWANDTDGFVLSAHPGQSQGRPRKSTGSQPIAQTACPACVLPNSPPSRSARRYGRVRTSRLVGLKGAVSWPEKQKR